MVEVLLVEKIIGLATIQDLGRFGYKSIGIPVSGALDKTSYVYSNLLLNNNVDDAVIELYGLMEFRVINDTLICITGGVETVTIDEVEYSAWKPLFVKKNSLVSIKPQRSPLIYISIYGGVKCSKVLGSRSTYLRAGIGCYSGSLKQNDVVESNTLPNSNDIKRIIDKEPLIDVFDKHIPKPEEEVQLRSTLGVHSDLIWDIDVLFKEKYWLSNEYDRMGYRLDGKPLESTRKLGRLPSIPVDRGCVQIPPNGKPIVLMSDSQTMGGYAVALHVLHPDVDRLAHVQPNQQKIMFIEVDVENAEEIMKNYLSKLSIPT